MKEKSVTKIGLGLELMNRHYTLSSEIHDIVTENHKHEEIMSLALVFVF